MVNMMWTPEDILILLRYNMKINTDQELQERTQPNPQPSCNFPWENLVSIHAELFNWKGKLIHVETTHGLVFVLLESQTEVLLSLTFRT